MYKQWMKELAFALSRLENKAIHFDREETSRGETAV